MFPKRLEIMANSINSIFSLGSFRIEKPQSRKTEMGMRIFFTKRNKKKIIKSILSNYCISLKSDDSKREK